MNVKGRRLPHDLAQRGRSQRRRDRPALAAARVPGRHVAQPRGRRRRDPRNVGARGPADRGDCGLWPCDGDTRGRRDAALDAAWERLHETRPTAINLRWALDEMRGRLRPLAPGARPAAAYARAAEIADEDVALNRAIGIEGLEIIRRIAAGQKAWRSRQHPHPLQRRMACAVYWGTALAPIYMAHSKSASRHVWVDETRPRNQGAQSHRLGDWQAWRRPHRHRRQRRRSYDAARLGRHGDRRHRPHHRARATSATRSAPTSRRSPRTTTACPSTSRFPSPTIDWSIRDGVKEIPIEERDGDEVFFVPGVAAPTARSPECGYRPTTARSPIPPSTSTLGAARHRPDNRTRRGGGLDRGPEGLVSGASARGIRGSERQRAGVCGWACPPATSIAAHAELGGAGQGAFRVSAGASACATSIRSKPLRAR